MNSFEPASLKERAASSGKSLYELIIEDLQNRIRSGDFSYEEPFCTEKQLSQTYQVSRITAKRAITELESQGILYRRRGAGSFVASSSPLFSGNKNSSQTSSLPSSYALLLPFDVTRGGIIDTVEVISDSLGSRGGSLGIYITNQNSSREKQMLKQLSLHPLTGLIYYPVSNQIYLDNLNSYILSGKPVIILDKTTDCPYLHNITSDNLEGGRLLTRHLLSLGHKKISFLTMAPIENTSSVRDRFAGFLEEIKKAGISPSSNCLFTAPAHSGSDADTENFLTDAVKKLVEQGTTAIIAENDIVAYAVWKACRTLQIRVPEDISLCGFDNNSWSRQPDSGITTISQDFAAIGSQVSSLLEKLEENPSLPCQKIVVPIHLEIRESTAPPKKEV